MSDEVKVGDQNVVNMGDHKEIHRVTNIEEEDGIKYITVDAVILEDHSDN